MGEWIQVTGYWFLDRPAGWQPTAELVDFIEAGPPPVYVGFGSMNNREAEVMARTVVDALAMAKQRAVIATGWGSLGDAALPETVFKVDAVPHDWLFPRMAAVVHHGGAGTTAEGLRAGVPSVIVPFIVDQPFWGARIRALGVGPDPIPLRRLTAGRLAQAIRSAATDPGMRQRARHLGAALRAEDGLACAVKLLREHLGPPRPEERD